MGCGWDRRWDVGTGWEMGWEGWWDKRRDMGYGGRVGRVVEDGRVVETDGGEGYWGRIAGNGLGLGTFGCGGRGWNGNA